MSFDNVNEKIMGATIKQLSNSFYGRTLLAKHKYKETIYTDSQHEVKNYINQPEF